MSQVEKFTAESSIEAKDYHYTWVINNFMLIRESSDGFVPSPVFTSDEIDFQFMFETKYYLTGNRTDVTKLYISSYSYLKRSLPGSYKLSIMKGDECVYTKTGTFPITTNRKSETIFEFPDSELERLISSTGTVELRCDVRAATGGKHTSSASRGDNPAHDESSEKNDYGWIFLKEELNDVTLKTRDGKEIPAHRLVLADLSPTFRAMFRHDEGQDKIKSVDLDMTYKTAIEMLRYIYTGKFNKKDFKLAMDLLVAADKYRLKELKSECEQIISSKLSIFNVHDILEVSTVAHSEFLNKRACDNMGMGVC